MSPDRLPAAPGHIADWEDLLVRFEIMPRALRVVLEDAPGAAAERVLRPLVEREAAAARWLGRLSGAEEVPPAAEGPHGPYERFASLRARNFAMVQRRGIEVWRWTGELEGHGELTAYQLLTFLVLEDARALAELRSPLAAC